MFILLLLSSSSLCNLGCFLFDTSLYFEISFLVLIFSWNFSLEIVRLA